MKPSVIVLTVLIALFWISVIWSIASDEAKNAPVGQKIKRVVTAVLALLAFFAAMFLLQWVLGIIDPSPPCFTDEQCADLNEVNRER